MSGAALTRTDRESMLKVVRMNERVAKTALKERSAQILADFEQKLAAEFKFDDDETWKTLTKDAKAFVDETDAKIAQRCAELGIPKAFRPGLTLGWHRRGENASQERRSELRRVAVSRISVMEAQGKAAIERRSAEIQTQLIAGGLASDEARRVLESLPKAEDLMPALALIQVEGAIQIGGAS